MIAWILALTVSAPAPSEHPELGVVRWERDFEAATQLAKRNGRPLLVLFDEVPGCATCVRYGRTTLSHPLLSEAAESEFVPVAVFNNLGGSDRELLERFREPSWNNPVVRILSPSGRDLAPRLAGDYRVETLAHRMRAALKASERPVPAYLDLLADSADGERSRFYLGMACFWSGQACVGALGPLARTRTGWMHGREVVEISVRTEDAEALLRQAVKRGCGSHLYAAGAEWRQLGAELGLQTGQEGELRPTPKDDLHGLGSHPLRVVPMTGAQAVRVNAALGTRRDPLEYLSPRQRGLAARTAARWRDLPDARAQPLSAAHRALEQALRDEAR